MPEKKDLTAEEIAKIVRMAGRGPIEAVLDKQAEIFKMNFDEINKISLLLDKVADNGCCSGAL